MNARSFALLCLPLSALLFAACGEDEGTPKQPTVRKGGNGGTAGKSGEEAGTGGDDGGGDAAGKGGTGGGTLTCKKHSACEAGEKLVRACSLCIQQVCDITPACCGEEWDENCVASAKRVPVCDCADTPSGGAGGAKAGAGGGAGSGPVTCHDTCVEGTRLDASCGTCAANVCKLDEFCCNNEWDAQCVFKASNVAEGCNCEPIDTCHSPCETGDALTAECDPCVADVCGAFENCCDPDNGGWGAYCVTAAKEACSVCQGAAGGAAGAGGKAGAGGAAGSKKCPENPCIPGGKAVAAESCNACIEAVITAKPTCADGWKQGCADLAKADASCGCGTGGTGGAGGKSGAAGTGGAAGAAGAAGKAGSAGSTGGSGGAATVACPVGACHPDSPLQSIDPKLCSSCATEIIAAHPECKTTWTAACAGYALKDFKGICGCPDLSKCGHDPCAWGQELSGSCSPCVARVCELDNFCCDDSGLEIEWDGACIAKWDKAIKDGDPACIVQDLCKP